MITTRIKKKKTIPPESDGLDKLDGRKPRSVVVYSRGVKRASTPKQCIDIHHDNSNSNHKVRGPTISGYREDGR